jgi:hypothetical protein
VESKAYEATRLQLANKFAKPEGQDRSVQNLQE